MTMVIAKRIISILIIILLVPMSLTFAKVGLIYQLELAGYSIGVSFDEANLIQPFQYTQHIDSRNHFVGYLDNVAVDDVEMDLRIVFKDDKAFKILARFSPKEVDRIVQKYDLLLGSHIDATKSFRDRSGNEIYGFNYKWIFPNAEVNVIRLSNNENFATLSLN